MNSKKTGNIIAYFITKLGPLDIYRLGKLLFFLDKRFYMLYGRTITELEYAKLPYGPAPDNYGAKYEELEADKYIKLDYSNNLNYVIYNKNIEPNISTLDEDEMNTLEGIITEYGNKSFDELVVITHNEKPWNMSKYSMGSIFDFEDLMDTEEDFLEALNDSVNTPKSEMNIAYSEKELLEQLS